MTARNVILLGALFAASAVAGFMFYDTRQTVASNDFQFSGAAPSISTRPVFSLPDVAGNERFVTEWDGKALIVNFWATWCAPCLREIPVLIDMQDALAEQDIQIIGIAIDDPAAVRDFAAKTAFNYPILVGEQEGIDTAAAFGAEVIALPITVFTDHGGNIIDLHAGEITRDDLNTALTRLSR